MREMVKTGESLATRERMERLTTRSPLLVRRKVRMLEGRTAWRRGLSL